MSAKLTGATLDKALQDRLNDWAEAWVTGVGWDDAVSHAVDE